MAEAIYPVSTGWLVQGRTWFSLGKHLEPPKPGRYSEKSVEKLRIMPSAIAVHLRLYTWDNMDLDLSFQVPLMEYRLYHKVFSEHILFGYQYYKGTYKVQPNILS